MCTPTQNVNWHAKWCAAAAGAAWLLLKATLHAVAFMQQHHGILALMVLWVTDTCTECKRLYGCMSIYPTLQCIWVNWYVNQMLDQMCVACLLRLSCKERAQFKCN